jgi:hypothetical protein
VRGAETGASQKLNIINFPETDSLCASDVFPGLTTTSGSRGPNSAQPVGTWPTALLIGYSFDD